MKNIYVYTHTHICIMFDLRTTYLFVSQTCIGFLLNWKTLSLIEGLEFFLPLSISTSFMNNRCSAFA